MNDPSDQARRRFLKRAGIAAGAAVPALGAPAWGGGSLADALGDFFQKHYREMSREEVEAALERVERRARRRLDVEIRCGDAPALDNVVFGYTIWTSTIAPMLAG